MKIREKYDRKTNTGITHSVGMEHKHVGSEFIQGGSIRSRLTSFDCKNSRVICQRKLLPKNTIRVENSRYK